MTEEEETNLKNWLAALANGFADMQQGVKLMTDVLVKLECRVSELERDQEPKSKIIHPFAARN